MVDWLKSQWRDIRKSAKWDAIKVVAIWVWPTMLTLIATAIAILKSLSIATRVYILVPVVSFLAQAVIVVVYRSRQGSKINIEVSTDDGFSAYAGITVTNKGEERLFRAEGQIEASNRPSNYPKGLFRLGWGNMAHPSAEIPQYASERVLLASFKDVKSPSLLEMTMWKIEGEASQVQWYARWLVEDQEELPYFRLKVVVIAEGTRQPWVRHFLVTPKTRLGPLGVSLVEAEV